jgi:phospholipase C
MSVVVVQYYASTRNSHHLAPVSVSTIGKTDQANHQYDLMDFYAALRNGNLPADNMFDVEPHRSQGFLGTGNDIDDR